MATTMRRGAWTAMALACWLASACDGPRDDGDAATHDAGSSDAAIFDAAMDDSGTDRDAGALDAGETDAGETDAAMDAGLDAGASYTLTVALSGDGSGRVTSSVAGIDCGADCEEVWARGTMVTLTATPDPGSRFAGWTTDDGSCAAAGPCTITMDRAHTVTAELRAFEATLLSETDRDPLTRLRDDRLAVDFFFQGAVRSNQAILPGSGVFYFEARRLSGELGPYGAGVATDAMPITGPDAYAGSSDQSFGVNADGGMTYDGGWSGAFPAAINDTYGFVVDYRGTTPTVYFIGNDDLGSGPTPTVIRTQPMTAVTTPLYIALSGSKRAIGYQIEINPGNDTTNAPFTFDPDAVLRAAGLGAVADAMVLGWKHTFAGPPDDTPTLTVSADLTVAPGTPVTLTATAMDREDGDLTASLTWELRSSPYYAGRIGDTGGSFTFTPTAIGQHPARVWVRDSAGQVSEATVMVTVAAPISQQNPVRLVPDALTGAGVVLSADGLSARWTGGGKMGIRANQSNYGEFWYFEFHRLIPPLNQGGGLVIGAGNLNPYSWDDIPPSCSINTSGGVWRNLIWQANFPDPDANAYDHYGFAVDYRGAHPIVYVIAGGGVVRVLHLDDVWVEIYPMIYGNPQGTEPGSFDSTINFGASPFFYDPEAALSAFGVDTTGFEAGWGNANTP